MAPPNVDQQGDAAAIIAAVDYFHDVQTLAVSAITPDSTVQVLAVPKGKEVISIKKFLDEYRLKPERLKGTARLQELDSFIAHVKRFKIAGTAIFADINRSDPHLLAVFDYHADQATPGFGEHRAIYAFPVSDEWKAWGAMAKKEWIAQTEFADFLEEHVGDIWDPSKAGDIAKKFASELGILLASPQQIMTLSKGLSISVGMKVTQHVNPATGETQMGFIEEHKNAAGESLDVPGGFILGIPFYRGGEVFQLPVRLRYDVAKDQQSVRWRFVLSRVQHTSDVAIKEACEAVVEETEGVPLFYGTPET